MNILKLNFIEKSGKKADQWAMKKFLPISIFNIIIIILFLLRSAGYFEPYFLISVNFIVVVGLILSVFLLNATNREMFIVSLAFWLFAAVLRILNIDTWAERTAIYSIESLFIGVVLLYYDS